MRESQVAILESAQKQERIVGARDPLDEERIHEHQNHLDHNYVIAGEEDAAVQEVAKIGRSLEADGPYKGKIVYKLIHHRAENALACGSTVYVYSGLLTALKTEAEVAGVIAHEISHIEHGDTWHENDAKRTMGEELSRGRIQEYLADNVSKKLAKAGYNPIAYERVLAYFASKEWNIGFTHGASADRQAAYRAQLHVLDHKETATADTSKKSNQFDSENLKPKQVASAFEEIFHGTAEAIIPESIARMERLDLKSLLMLHSSHIGNIESHRHTMSSENYRRRYDRERRAKHDLDLRHRVRLVGALDRVIGEKVRNAVPDDETKRLWLQTILYTEVQRIPLTQLQDITGWVDTVLPSALRQYGNDIEASITTEAQLIDLAHLTRSYSDLSVKAGCVPYIGQHPDTIFPKHTSFDRERGSFPLYTKITERIHATSDASEKLSTLREMGSALESFKPTNRQGHEWVKSEANLIYMEEIEKIRNMVETNDPRLYKNDIVAAYTAKQQEIVERVTKSVLEVGTLLRQCKVKDPETALLQSIQSLVYRDFREKGLRSTASYEFTDQLFQQIFQIVVEEKKKGDTRVADFVKAASAATQEERFAYFSTLDLETLKAVREATTLDEIFPESSRKQRFVKDAIEFMLRSYEPTDHDVRTVSILCQRRSFTPALEEWKASLDQDDANLRGKLEEIGLGKQGIRILAALELLRMLGGGSTSEEILNSLEQEKLSDPAQSIILDAILRLKKGSYGYRELNDKRVTPLRDAVARSLEHAPLHEGLRAILKLKIAAEGKGSLTSRDQLSANEFLAPLALPLLDRIQEITVDQNNPKDWTDLYDLIGMLFDDDRRSRSQLQQIVAERAIKCMDYEQGKAYLDSMLQQRELPLSAADHFQENLMRTPEQMKEASALAENVIAELHKFGDSTLGVLAGIDWLTEKALEYEFSADDILASALESHKNDTKLRVVLARVWYLQYRDALPRFKAGQRLDAIARDAVYGSSLRAFVPFERFVNEFYTNMTQTDIDIALHKLLLSPNGVLRSYGGKKIIIDILKNEVDNSDPAFQKLLMQIAASGLEEVDPVRIYRPIADILRNRIFIRPQKSGNNAPAVRELKEAYTIKNVSEIADIRSQRRFVDALFRFKRPAEQEPRDPYELPRVPLVSARRLRRSRAHVRGLVPIPERSTQTQKVPPLDYVLNVAKNMGAVGVRFLQLLGQYVDIPEEYREKFDSIYDSVRGQLKWTAWKTLEREESGPQATSQLRDFYANLADLSPTIGGGSLMTVYTATLKDGSKHVLKVLNPNAEEFIRQNIADAENILNRLGVRRYPFARFLLQDLERWLMEDINSRHKSTDKDEFVELHPATTINVNGQAVPVTAPRQIPTGSKYILIEQFIEGKNLSELVATNDSRAGAYIRAMEESYKTQLETFSPDGKTRIHPDVHMGNIRISNDGALYWIDRGHYVECTRQEMDMLRPFFDGTVTLESSRAAIRFLLSLPENRHISSGMSRLRFQMRAAQRFLAISSRDRGASADELADKYLTSLRELGLQVPIRFSLLFKNARAIEKMKERTAG